MTAFDLIGVAGVLLCLLAYTLNLLQRLPTTGPAYPGLNAISSGLILTSLGADFNLASVLMEGSWLGVSLFAVLQATRQKS